MNEPRGIEAFVNFVDRHVKLTQDEKVYLAEVTPVEHFRKGEHLLEEGEVMNHWYYVIGGCLRTYYNVDGMEKTTWFFEEDNIVHAYESFLNQTPASHYLQCIEDCQLASVSRELGEQIWGNHPKYNFISQMRSRMAAMQYEDVITSLLTQDSEERYLHFVERHPGLMQRIPLNQIATYLGIRPETLSRIRKNIKRSIKLERR